MNQDNNVQVVMNQLEEVLKMRGTPYEGLLELYALLVLVVGVNCTQEHVHDAWSVWQNKTRPNHRSLIPFQALSPEVQALDEKYRLAIVEVARVMGCEK